MSQILLEVPDDSLLALRTSAHEAGPELLLAAAVKLYELNGLSSGAAAHLAGAPRTVFLQRLAEFGVDAFRLSAEQLQREVRLGLIHLQHLPAPVSPSGRPSGDSAPAASQRCRPRGRR